MSEKVFERTAYDDSFYCKKLEEKKIIKSNGMNGIRNDCLYCWINTPESKKEFKRRAQCIEKYKEK